MYDELLAAVRIVSSVHGDGPLPSIPMLLVSASSQIRGRFWYGEDGPTAISIDLAHRHRGFAAVHEIGHFLDFSGIGAPNTFASETADELAAWRAAAVQSRQVRRLGRSVEAIAGQVAPEVALIYHAYLDLPEIWARSYAQYVTIRSRDAALEAGLAAHRTAGDAEPATIERLLHWDDDDFAPVAAAIERLFRRLGWRSER